MKQPYIIRTTKDGSRTLYCNQYRQSFHSMHGALTESRHVFIEGTRVNRLCKSKRKVRVLEIGFGAGLNWLLTASIARQHGINLSYTAVDQSIPDAELLSELRYGDITGSPLLEAILIDWRNTFLEQVPTGVHPLAYEPSSILQLIVGDAATVDLSSQTYDCIYLDAFDPRVNPTLWTLDFIQKLSNLLRTGGYLATYSAAGHVRRALIESGFSVTRRPGPPGKREVLTAQKPEHP